ncbi:BTAD domain-containing putative transcriptional regulator [Yinghuangia soli]|uniref:BTAD domain-containing putative transcriptional regulator n=1 Tax=Yinghuangia soli TaxID=2908204 RepID=UPI002285472B|nr:BTAD domain-containing putative transcriptional regulator [Yinghuangia soli]
MRFDVLGPVAVHTDAGVPVAVPGAKVRALLADLLVHHGSPVSADRLVEDLWGDTVPGNPANTLQTKISQLRRALDGAEPGARGLVARLPAGYRLQAEDDAVDAARFTALLGRARYESDPGTRIGLLVDALALWRGPAFADFQDADFARAAAAKLAEQRLTAQEDLAELRLARGEHGLVAGELADLAAEHPLRERLRAAHMQALYRAGRPSEALAAFQDLRTRLADDLGLDPGPEITALHQAILRQDPDLAALPRTTAASTPTAEAAPAASSPAAPPVPRPRTNLPARTAEPIGRDEQTDRVCARLAGTRLLTLTGPGGVGKTSLALAAARRLADHPTGAEDPFPDGVHLVELAAERAGADAPVAAAIAAALGLRDEAADRSSATERLAAALASRRLLLVLDNCEHVVDEAAALTARLLRATHGVRILCTSQEPLAVAGEEIEAVAPLDEADAVRLFTERAAAAAPGFTLGPGDAETAAAICRRLDNLPLAVELAAARVRVLGVAGLADRLDDRFRVLAAGRRDAPSRQRTLRAMIDWSWEPLTAPERAVLRRLAVFRNGCTLAAAEAVCGPRPHSEPNDAYWQFAPDAPDVLDIVTRLADRSLVTVVQGAAGPRYRLLESVAAYGRERLAEAGETAESTARHRACFTAFAERAEPHLVTREQRTWLSRLDDDAANLRAALESGTAPANAEAHAEEAHATQAPAAEALRLANALSWYWMLRGRLAEACRSLDAALTAAAPTLPGRADAQARRAAFGLLRGDGTGSGTVVPDAAPRAAWMLAFARVGFGSTADVAPELDRLLSAFKANGDRWGEAATYGTRASKAIYDGDLPALRANAAAAADLFAELGDRWGHLRATEQLGILAEIGGDYTEAARLHRQAVRSAEDLHLWVDVSFRLARLGRTALLSGDIGQADDFHARALDLARGQSHKPAEQFAATGLAIGARRRGDLDLARDLLTPWVAWNRSRGVAAGEALVLAQLGLVAEQQGDAAAALALHLEGHAAAERTGDPRAVAYALEGLAGARAAAGTAGDAEAAAQAASLLGTAEALRASVGSPLPAGEREDADRAAAAARATLGEAACDAAHRSGLSRTAEDQVAAVRAATGTGGSPGDTSSEALTAAAP